MVLVDVGLLHACCHWRLTEEEHEDEDASESVLTSADASTGRAQKRQKSREYKNRRQKDVKQKREEQKEGERDRQTDGQTDRQPAHIPRSAQKALGAPWTRGTTMDWTNHARRRP